MVVGSMQWRNLRLKRRIDVVKDGASAWKEGKCSQWPSLQNRRGSRSGGRKLQPVTSHFTGSHSLPTERSGQAERALSQTSSHSSGLWMGDTREIKKQLRFQT